MSSSTMATQSVLDRGASGSQMRHYQLGDCLGRGAFGSVYRGLNVMTGETVAVKQIQLGNIPRSELGEIMSEIDLLKNLKHPNIVKYKGSEKTKEHLNIILEYCENGSLQHICKRFGKFPEGLVGVYISQVLEGLCYLHDQGVIHRDIKGANILTTKDGSVKLADFGVATKAGSILAGSNNPVVGSPYWMAPEVIDQSGATTASDIWSVGCVVIELLEGKPPYHYLDPMPALFRIVQDDCPPLPESASPIVKDFLVHCFQKDANLRITARKLGRHPWMMSAKRQLEQMRTGGSLKGETVYDEAVKSVQEWNEALREPPAKALGASRHQNEQICPTSPPPIPPRRLFANKENISPSKEGQQNHSDGIEKVKLSSRKKKSSRALNGTKVAPMLPLTQVSLISAAPSKPTVTATLLDQHHDSQQKEEETDNWDDDFEEGIPIRRLTGLEKPLPTIAEDASPRVQLAPLQSESPRIDDMFDSVDDNSATIRPLKYQLSSVDREDYSDLLEGDEAATLMEKKIRQLKARNGNSNGLGLGQPNGIRQHDSSKFASPVSLRKSAPPIGANVAANVSHPSLGKYAELDLEDDYSDLMSNPNEPLLHLNNRLSNRSWSQEEKDDEDENDPFAQFDNDDFFNGTSLAANIARDQHARLCAQISELVDVLDIKRHEDDILWACDSLEIIMTNQPEMKAQVLAAHGALTVIQLLEVTIVDEIVSRLLGLLNVITYQDALAQENLCLIGAIPVVMTFTSSKYPDHIRIEAAHFVFAMCSTSNLTLQFVLSCRGLKTLVELIDGDYNQQKDLVCLGVACVNSVLELQSPASRNSFCRMLATEGLLEPLTVALLCVIDDGIENGEDAEYAISAKVHILQILLIYSSSDAWLKEKLATRSNLRRILQACRKLEPESLTIMLKAIKNLSMSPSVVDEMENCNTIEVLIKLLECHHNGAFGTEMSNQVLNTMYNLCRLNKRRQEEAAQAGIIPLLLRIAGTSSPLKQFALPILCDLAHTSKSTRKILNQQCGLDFFLQLLQDPYWQLQSLESILIWLQEDLARMESVLLKPSSIQSLLSVFISAKSLSFEQFLETFLKLFKLSHGVTLALGKQPAFLQRLAERLRLSTKAVVKLNLLRICKAVCDVVPDRQEALRRNHLTNIIEALSKEDGTVLVQEVARDIITLLRQSPNGLSLVAQEAHRTVRRAASENNVARASHPSTPNRASPGTSSILSSSSSKRGSQPIASPPPSLSTISPQRAPWGESSVKHNVIPSISNNRAARNNLAFKSRLFQEQKKSSDD